MGKAVALMKVSEESPNFKNVYGQGNLGRSNPTEQSYRNKPLNTFVLSKGESGQ